MMVTSAQELLVHLRDAALRFRSRGRKLNEGADRVLRKLEMLRPGDGFRRAYLRFGASALMWDLVSDDELARRGFAPTRHRACHIFADDPLKNDRITCWISEVEAADELWIGEPLVP